MGNTNHGTKDHGKGHGHASEKKKKTAKDARKDPHFPIAPKMRWKLRRDYRYAAGSPTGRLVMLHSIWLVYGFFALLFVQGAVNWAQQTTHRLENNWSQSFKEMKTSVGEFASNAKASAANLIPSAQADTGEISDREAHSNPYPRERNEATIVQHSSYYRHPEMTDEVYADAVFACNAVGYSPKQFYNCTSLMYNSCESESGNLCLNLDAHNPEDAANARELAAGNAAGGGSYGPLQIRDIHRSSFDERTYGMNFDECRAQRRCAMWFYLSLIVRNGFGVGNSDEERFDNQVLAILRTKGVGSYEGCATVLTSYNEVVRGNRTPEIESGIESGRYDIDQLSVGHHCQRFS